MPISGEKLVKQVRGLLGAIFIVIGRQARLEESVKGDCVQSPADNHSGGIYQEHPGSDSHAVIQLIARFAVRIPKMDYPGATSLEDECGLTPLLPAVSFSSDIDRHDINRILLVVKHASQGGGLKLAFGAVRVVEVEDLEAGRTFGSAQGTAFGSA